MNNVSKLVNESVALIEKEFPFDPKDNGFANYSIGDTLDTVDGHKITITDIKLLGAGMDPEVQIIYDWVDMFGKKGKGQNGLYGFFKLARDVRNG